MYITLFNTGYKRLLRLDNLKIGETGVLQEPNLINPTIGRLMELGMIRSTTITLLGKIFLNNIIQVLIKETSYLCFHQKNATFFYVYIK